MERIDTEMGSFECAFLSPLAVIYMSNQSIDVRAGTLKILLHVLEVLIFRLGMLAILPPVAKPII